LTITALKSYYLSLFQNPVSFGTGRAIFQAKALRNCFIQSGRSKISVLEQPHVTSYYSWRNFMELIKWYKAVLSKYAIFEGRARRKEYWFFALTNCIIAGILMIISNRIDFFDVLSGIYGFAVLVPGLAVGVRRLHDTNRSGVHILFALIPIVGSILLLVWLAKEGNAGDNQYGPSPKALPAA
jgi:uncharacterized membrane protein YhaH (DUF805 family)